MQDVTDLNHAFIRAFEDLKAEINRRAGIKNSHSLELHLAVGRDRSVAKSERYIRYFRDVRNALQHPNHNAKAHAFQVTEAFVEEVKKLLHVLQNPLKASSICVKRGDLFIARVDDSIGEIADKMKTMAFSHVPILNQDDIILGVFNEAAIFDYFWSDNVIDASRDLTISKILLHCNLNANHTETFRFVRPTTTKDYLVTKFTNLESNSTRIGAIFVTPSGKKSESITGMLTPWDLLSRISSHVS